MNAVIVVDFDSEWIVAGGESHFGTSDMAPLRDAEGFPFIPGRTLRGVLREALSTMDDCLGLEGDDAWAVRLFGRRLSEAAPGFGTFKDGMARVGNARLVAEVADLCRDGEERLDLCTRVRRTALGGDRIAVERSLREMEVCIAGLTLVADVELPDRESLSALAFACRLVRSLGHGRSRGLGRCRLSVVHEGSRVEQTTLPATREAHR